MSIGSVPATLSVGDARFGKTRQAVLGLLFGKAGRSYYVDESDLAPVLRKAERAIARRISVTLLDRATFAQRRKERKRLLTGTQWSQRRRPRGRARALTPPAC